MRKFFTAVFLALTVALCAGTVFHGYAADSVEIQFVRKKAERFRQIDYLKRIRRAQLAPLIEFFDSLKSENLVRWYAPLWIVRGIVWDGVPRTLELARKRFPEYSFRRDAVDSAALREPFPDPMSSDAVYLDSDSCQWNIRIMGLDRIRRKFGVYGDGTLVGIFDSGISRWVPQLRDNIFLNSGEGTLWNGVDDDGNSYPDDIWGYNFFDTTSHPYDDKGHGTHVSGTAVGDPQIGVAPDAQLVALKVLNSSGSGRESAVWQAIEYALELGVDVANFSIGWRHSTSPDRPMWREVIANAMALGMVCVAGAGNEGSDSPPDNIRTPGDVPEIITVGAVDSTLALASFSSTGPVEWPDFPYPPGLTKPDISAPGVGVVSCVIPGGFEAWDGTSMATPHITGVCALLKQINPDITPAEIKAILESTAVDLGDPGKDNQFGSGFVNVESALMAVAEWCTLAYYSAVPGTLVVMPYRTKFFGTGDTILIPAGAEFAVFFADGYEPDTIRDLPCGGEIEITPEPITRTCRVGILDSRTAEPLSGEVYFADETLAVDGFGEISLPSVDVWICATAIGYNLVCDSVRAEDECKFLFLHKCEDFEDSAVLVGNGDWEWGTPTSGPHSARSGNRLWATALADTYRSSSNSWLWSGWQKISPGATLYVWQWYDCEATDWGFWDGGNVVADFGSDTVVLFPIGDYDCWIDDYDSVMAWQPAFSGTLLGNFWHQKVFPILVDEPCSVRIGFHFGSDDNTTRPGWYIDDIFLADGTPPSPVIRSVEVNADSVRICAYSPGTPMEDVSLVLCEGGEVEFATQVACDTFEAVVEGAPGDTVAFVVVAVNSLGVSDTFPLDTCLVAVIPNSGVGEKPEGGIKLTAKRTLEGFLFGGNFCRLYVVDIRGNVVFRGDLEAGSLVWRPRRAGVYFAVAKRGKLLSVKKLLWVR